MGTAKLSGWVLAGLICVLPTRQAQASESAYEVQPGDSLWSLSRERGCSVERLKRANDLRDDLIRIGRRLTIPRCAAATPRAASRRYTVRSGDTLSHIALRFDTSVDALQDANGLGDSSLIVIGQALAIPRGSQAAPISTSRSQSIGSPWRGRLDNGVQLPQDSSYYRRRIANAYATLGTITHLRKTLRRVRELHPKLHRIAVGDLSSRRGGPLSGHRSHQSGRDVDLGLYFERRPHDYPQRFVAAHEGRLALGPMWTLLELLARDAGKPGGAQYVFLDYEIQKRIYRYARKRGVSKTKLRRIFQYPDGRGVKDRLVRHEANHDDHIHIRYHCSKDDPRCKS